MNKQFNRCLKNLRGKTVDELFEEISVLDVADMIENFKVGSKMYNLNAALKDWVAVANDDGIIAYFGERSEAFRFRLDYINRILNN